MHDTNGCATAGNICLPLHCGVLRVNLEDIVQHPLLQCRTATEVCVRPLYVYITLLQHWVSCSYFQEVIH